MALRDFTEAWQQMNTDHDSPGVHKHKSTVPQHYMCLTFLSPSMVKQFALTEDPPHQIWSAHRKQSFLWNVVLIISVS